MRWKLACQEQLLPGETLSQKWEFAQAAGFDGIELRGKGGGAFEARLPELERAAADGVVMPSVCVDMLHFFGDFDAARRSDAIAQLSAQLAVIARVGGRLAMTPASYGMFSRRLPPFEPPRSPADDREVLLDGLRRMGEQASAEGVRLCLEPLNRYEDHMVNTLGQAAELCAATGLDSVRVAADSYHMNIEEADPPASLRAAGPMLSHVQVSDSNRLEPGQGHIDWPAHFRALHEIGYDGWIAFECRLSGPASDVLPAAVRTLRLAAESAKSAEGVA